MSALDEILRLVVASAAGIAIGFNREWRQKPLGMRTLALVALGSALAPLAALHFRDFASAEPQPLARVVQGIIEGVLAGIGFIGAGAVMRDRNAETVEGLTTAATVWVTAAIGIACALADWTLVLTGVILTLGILFGLNWIETRLLGRQP